MAKAANQSTKRHIAAVLGELDSDATHLRQLTESLLADAHPEDLAAIDPVILAAGMTKTAKALADHKKGGSVVRVESIADTSWCVASVINENMPFLFDSVLGEINDASHNTGFVVHPILEVKHTKDTFEIVDKSRPGLAREETIRTSVIHVLIPDLDDDATSTLEAGLAEVIKRVKDAVRDWRAMLTRLDEVIEELRTGVLPIKKADANEALAFLEWLRDDNFTFLGIREYDYRGGATRGQLVRADLSPLGILSDPQLRVMRRGDEPVTTTPQIRAFLNSRSQGPSSSPHEGSRQAFCHAR